MNNLKVGDPIGLDWIKGNGNGKVVGLYQDYVTIIHPCFNKPKVFHRDSLVPPETCESDAKNVANFKLFENRLIGQIQQLEIENQSLHGQITQMENEQLNINKQVEYILGHIHILRGLI